MGQIYKVFGTIRNHVASNSTVANLWMDFNDGDGWLKLITDRVWSPSNWNPGSVPAGYTDTTAIQTGGATAVKRYRLAIRNNNQEISYQTLSTC